MPDVKRQVKIITTQRLQDGAVEPPMRDWTISIVLVGPGNEDVPANVFEKVTYNLHETFGDRQKQTFKEPPFKLKEEGWGEFDMIITATAPDKGGEFTFNHDLNFQNERYESRHPITFKSPKPALLEKLRASGSVPGDANGVKGAQDSAKKKKKADKSVDMETLAANLQKLTEDNLLTVVQMIHDNKTEDTYTKNDTDAGEFHVDLFTLPDSLVQDLDKFAKQKIQSAA